MAAISDNLDNGEAGTDEQMEAWFNTDPVLAQARRDGVDLWALWANLHRPVEERIIRLEMAVSTYYLLHDASKR